MTEATTSAELIDEIRRLRAQNEALNEQVKLLVKTEQRLYRSQAGSGRQVARIQALSDLALTCASEEDESQILRHTCQLLSGVYDVDDALTLCLDQRGSGLRVCCSSSPAGAPGRGRLAADTLDWARSLSGPQLVPVREPSELEPALAAILSLVRDANEQDDFDTMLLLPIRDQKGELQHLPLAWTRAGRTGSFHREPLDERQLPYLRLLASHVEGALQAATLTRDLRRQGERLAEANEQLQASLAHLEQAQAQLLQSQKMEAVGRLAGGVAHDFNNLLTVILGHAQLLELALPEASGELADVQQVVDAGERAANIARQLLAFSRRQPRRLEVVDLNELVVELSRMLERLLGDDVTLVLQLQASAGRIRGDRAQLEQALLNLVVNARDAMPDGGRLTIETRPATDSELDEAGERTPADRFLAIAVSDTGTGMEEDVRNQALEPFFTTKEVGQGTGLGLSMVYGIVRQGNGRVCIDSAPGQGTTVTLLVPSVSAEADVPASRTAEGPPSPGASGTVLVVEDEPSIRALAARVLRDAGCEVLEAENGRAALALASSHGDGIDLLLTDVVMPKLGGPELAARLRESRPELAVLFMTGHAREGLAQRGLAIDSADCLDKPFRPDELRARVCEVLRSARSGAEG